MVLCRLMQVDFLDASTTAQSFNYSLTVSDCESLLPSSNAFPSRLECPFSFSQNLFAYLSVWALNEHFQTLSKKISFLIYMLKLLRSDFERSFGPIFACRRDENMPLNKPLVAGANDSAIDETNLSSKLCLNKKQT